MIRIPDKAAGGVSWFAKKLERVKGDPQRLDSITGAWVRRIRGNQDLSGVARMAIEAAKKIAPPDLRDKINIFSEKVGLLVGQIDSSSPIEEQAGPLIEEVRQAVALKKLHPAIVAAQKIKDAPSKFKAFGLILESVDKNRESCSFGALLLLAGDAAFELTDGEVKYDSLLKLITMIMPEIQDGVLRQLCVDLIDRLEDVVKQSTSFDAENKRRKWDTIGGLLIAAGVDPFAVATKIYRATTAPPHDRPLPFLLFRQEVLDALGTRFPKTTEAFIAYVENFEPQ